jgi:hypothetical protein
VIAAIERSPKTYARVAGAMYLAIIAAGVFAEVFVRGPLTAAPDATAAAARIEGHESLLRMGIVADLSTFLLAIPVTLILYVLLRRVHEDLALLAVLLNLVQDAVGAINALNTYRPLLLLGGADSLSAFTREQLGAMALLALKEHAVGFAIALIFFGAYCVVLGSLVVASRLLPRVLGGLLVVAGLCYLVNSLAVLLSPALSALLFPAILLPAFVGELAFALWLTVKGVAATTPPRSAPATPTA